MNESTVSVRGLIKKYGSSTAINGISFETKPGEVFGLLGANGAGKTSTFECLEGLRKATEGTIRVAGCDPLRDAKKLRKRLGVQLQSSSLPENIRVDEAFSLISAWQGVKTPAALIEQFQISELLGKQYHQLSTGQKRRVHLALALVHHPQVLILDEPTAGLDVQSRAHLHDEIRAVKSQGTTVLLATHDMAEAESLCDRIAILVGGKIAVCGTPEEITATGSKETRIRLRTARNTVTPQTAVNGAAFIREKDGYLEWRCRNVAVSVAQIISCVEQNSDSIEDLRVERPSLEERFLELAETVNRKQSL